MRYHALLSSEARRRPAELRMAKPPRLVLRMRELTPQSATHAAARARGASLRRLGASPPRATARARPPARTSTSACHATSRDAAGRAAGASHQGGCAAYRDGVRTNLNVRVFAPPGLLGCVLGPGTSSSCNACLTGAALVAIIPMQSLSKNGVEALVRPALSCHAPSMIAF